MRKVVVKSKKSLQANKSIKHLNKYPYIPFVLDPTCQLIGYTPAVTDSNEGIHDILTQNETRSPNRESANDSFSPTG